MALAARLRALPDLGPIEDVTLRTEFWVGMMPFNTLEGATRHADRVQGEVRQVTVKESSRVIYRAAKARRV